MVLQKERAYLEDSAGFWEGVEKFGHWGRSYPMKLDSATLLGLSREDKESLAILSPGEWSDLRPLKVEVFLKPAVVQEIEISRHVYLFALLIDMLVTVIDCCKWLITLISFSTFQWNASVVSGSYKLSIRESYKLWIPCVYSKLLLINDICTCSEFGHSCQILVNLRYWNAIYFINLCIFLCYFVQLTLRRSVEQPVLLE